MLKRLALTMMVAASVLVSGQAFAVDAAMADSVGCVTHGEYDNMAWGLSTDQVASRFDTNGTYLSSGDVFFKRGYDACWTTDKRVVVWYELTVGLSDHWDVR